MPLPVSDIAFTVSIRHNIGNITAGTMFTGLVEGIASVASLHKNGAGARLVLRVGELAAGLKIGDSVAVSGCCLTVVAIEGDRLSFDVGPETLGKTTLGNRAVGSRVNIERSLKAGDPLGGHFVTGHIDGVGRLAERRDDAEWSTCTFTLPTALAAHLACKGSIAIEGVSLTLCDVGNDRFRVMLIPHTLAVTTLGELRAGDPVNLETDVLAKYVERQLAGAIERLK